MNTRFLETFVCLAKLKSFSRTAEKLNASQPAVSGRIVALENMLGAPLYDRNARGFELTSTGRRILEQCEKIVELTRELTLSAENADIIGRPVRVGMSDMVSMSWLPDLLDVLEVKFPDQAFQITTDAAPNLTVALNKHQLDLVFIANGVDDPRIINAPLCSYRIAWLANPRRFDTHTVISVEQLCRLPIIMPPPGTPSYVWQTEYLKRHNPAFERESTDKTQLSCGFSPATAIEMVRAGLGVMPVAVLLAQAHIKSGDIAIMPVREPFPAMHMVAAYKTPPTFPMITDLVECAQAVAKAYSDRNGGKDIWP